MYSVLLRLSIRYPDTWGHPRLRRATVNGESGSYERACTRYLANFRYPSLSYCVYLAQEVWLILRLQEQGVPIAL